MCVAVREEEVDDDAADGEQKDEQAPQNLGEDLSGRLQNLDYREYVSAELLLAAWARSRRVSGGKV